MILDAATTAKVIRHTITMLKQKNAMYKHEPARSILLAFEELASSFDLLTGASTGVSNIYDPLKNQPDKVIDDATVASLKKVAES